MEERAEGDRGLLFLGTGPKVAITQTGDGRQEREPRGAGGRTRAIRGACCGQAPRTCEGVMSVGGP